MINREIKEELHRGFMSYLQLAILFGLLLAWVFLK